MISTVSIGQLDSVADLVEKITGDPGPADCAGPVLLDADEIELVDVAPEALQDRMARYLPPAEQRRRRRHRRRTSDLRSRRPRHPAGPRPGPPFLAVSSAAQGPDHLPGHPRLHRNRRAHRHHTHTTHRPPQQPAGRPGKNTTNTRRTQPGPTPPAGAGPGRRRSARAASRANHSAESFGISRRQVGGPRRKGRGKIIPDGGAAGYAGIRRDQQFFTSGLLAGAGRRC